MVFSGIFMHDALGFLQTGHANFEKRQTWYIGEGLAAGDYFEYEICDMVRIADYSFASHCYHVYLEFVDVLESQRRVWIVQATATDGISGTPVDAVLHVDSATFKAGSVDASGRMLSDSVSRTLFWIAEFATKQSPKQLDIGKSWGMVSSKYGSELVVRAKSSLSIKNGNEVLQVPYYTVGHFTDRENTVAISDEFPFPIKAEVFKSAFFGGNAVPKFSLELTGYGNANENDTTTKVPRPPVFEDVMHGSEVQEICFDEASLEKLFESFLERHLAENMTVPTPSTGQLLDHLEE